MMKLRKSFFLALTLMIILLAAGAALAQSTGYDVSWWSVDGGGSRISSQGYTLESTIGQPDAAPPLTGNGYALSGGFWAAQPAASPPGNQIYLPLVMRK